MRRLSGCRQWQACQVSHPPLHPIRIATACEMLEHRYRVAVWCPACKVWREVNLAEMVMRGRGDESLMRRRWVCRDCGGLGKMQLRVPVPHTPGYEPRNKPGGG